jgi:outer membrane protein OmpA-like peptidoglycan-associated protein
MIAAVAMASPGHAQVTIDLHALQALPNRSAPERAPPSRPASSRPPSSGASSSGASSSGPSSSGPSSSQASRPAPQSAAPVASANREAPGTSPSQAPRPEAPQPALPENVPATASINPIAPPPPSGVAPPPPPVSDTATTAAAQTSAGLRLTFASEQSDLSPDSIKSIKELTAKAPPGDDTTFNVQAYAPGKRDDPSTARRVSLSRAMAVRSALVADGVPSARIFVRALGEQYGDGPPDRVDIAVSGPGGASGSGAAAR